MSCVRGQDTKPELLVRTLLHGLGYRFTVNGPRNRNLPGKPDIVLPRHRTCVFVHGCFWHGHLDCKYARIPKTRPAWWRAKIERNRTRDARNLAELENRGWNAIVVWTCRLRTRALIEAFAATLPELVEWSDGKETFPLKVAEPGTEYGSNRSGNE